MRIDIRSLTVTALLWLGLLLVPSPIHAQPSTPDQKQTTHEYSLPPDKLKQAIEYSHARNWLAFGGTIYGIPALLPMLFTIMFLEPFVIEPLFFEFQPLAKQHAALVGELEKVVIRGGLVIPPDRMFEMKASEKLNSLNAYVTGLGASKRVVIWD